jgi:hypothetical protein
MASNDKTPEHKHGTMQIRDHERTFESFVRFVAWGIGISIAVLIFLALANS